MKARTEPKESEPNSMSEKEGIRVTFPSRKLVYESKEKGRKKRLVAIYVHHI